MKNRKELKEYILLFCIAAIVTISIIGIYVISEKEKTYKENNFESIVLECKVVDKYELDKLIDTHYVVVVIMSNHTVHKFKDEYYYYAYDVGDTFTVLEKSWEGLYQNEYEIIE